MPRRARRGGIASAVVLILAAAVVGAGWLYQFTGLRDTGGASFSTALWVPPLLDPTNDRYPLELRTGTTELVDGRRTPTWGVNGAHLGPTLRATRGDRVSMSVRNELPEATSIHWHGMHLPAAMDGGPHQPIEAGATWRPEWTVDQPAATTWYHPHLHGTTAAHVGRGVLGMFIVDEDGGPDLPAEYGVDDLPVIVQDAALHDDGTFDEKQVGPPASWIGVGATGKLGQHVLVNGVDEPVQEVTSTLVRLRVLNASQARVYNVGFTDDRSFSVIAGDAGLLERPVEVDRVTVSPGERVEIVVGFAAGDDVVLRSHPQDLGTGFPSSRFLGGEDTLDLLRLRAADRLTASPALPGRLGGPAPVEAAGAARERTFDLGSRSTINGEEMDLSRIDVVARAGSREVWQVEGAGTPHSFHIHGVSFTVLDVDGRAPPEYLRGRKDTVFVPASSTVRLAVQLDRYSDPERPYMFHCHLLRHEDLGMMGQLIVVSERDEGLVPDRLEAPHQH